MNYFLITRQGNEGQFVRKFSDYKHLKVVVIELLGDGYKNDTKACSHNMIDKSSKYFAVVQGINVSVTATDIEIG